MDGSPRASRAARRGTTGEEEWLLIEWPKAEKKPTKYWLSTLLPDIAWARMADLAKLRGRIERDYQELKQEFRLGHFEGRSWRGFHHHTTMCIAAYGFLISDQETIPPRRHAARPRELPAHYRPRGATDPNRTAHAELDRLNASPPDRRTHQTSTATSLLRANKRTTKTPRLVTQ